MEDQRLAVENHMDRVRLAKEPAEDRRDFESDCCLEPRHWTVLRTDLVRVAMGAWMLEGLRRDSEMEEVVPVERQLEEEPWSPNRTFQHLAAAFRRHHHHMDPTTLAGVQEAVRTFLQHLDPSNRRTCS